MKYYLSLIIDKDTWPYTVISFALYAHGSNVPLSYYSSVEIPEGAKFYFSCPSPLAAIIETAFFVYQKFKNV